MAQVLKWHNSSNRTLNLFAHNDIFHDFFDKIFFDKLHAHLKGQFLTETNMAIVRLRSIHLLFD